MHVNGGLAEPDPSEIGVSVDNTVKVTLASSHAVLFNILILYP